MSLKTDRLLTDFTNALKMSNATGTKPYDTTAEVTRVDVDTVWVHIPSGVYETPIRKTINCVKGDLVQVRVSGGTAWITGNVTAPPTDDTLAKNAQDEAREANAEALNAKESADIAQETADSAQDTANGANSAIYGTGGLKDQLEIISGAVDIQQGVNPYVLIHTDTATGEMNAGVKITDKRLSFMQNAEIEVAYIDSSESDGILDINNARIHKSIKIGELEIIEFRGGIGIRRA